MSGYEFDFIVGSGIEKHSGVFLETGIETLLNGYLGEVEIAKLGGAAKPEYVNARDGFALLALAIQPRDELRFRIKGSCEEAGKLASKIKEAIS